MLNQRVPGTRSAAGAAPLSLGWTHAESQQSATLGGCPARAGLAPHRTDLNIGAST